MSVKASTWIWRHSPTTGTERLVLLALADMSNGRAESWPSVPTLARMTKRSARSVNYALSSLADKGLIEITPGGGRGNTNLYRLVLRAVETLQEPAETLQSATVNPAICDAPTLIKEPKENRKDHAAKTAATGKIIPIKRADPYWEAAVDAFSIDEQQMTPVAKRTLALALNQVKAIKADPGEIRLRLARYRELHPTWEATAHALVKHWHECVPAPVRHRRESSHDALDMPGAEQFYPWMFPNQSQPRSSKA